MVEWWVEVWSGAESNLFAGDVVGVCTGIGQFDMIVQALWPSSAMLCLGSRAMALHC